MCWLGRLSAAIKKNSMKQLFIFVQKEFIQVFRDRKTLLVLFGMPVAQILIFGFALSGEIKEAKILIVNEARDPLSQRLIRRLDASPYFHVESRVSRPGHLQEAFKQGKARIALVIPANFSEDLDHLGHAQLQLINDASDPNYATTLAHYATAIIEDFQATARPKSASPYTVVPDVQMLYNPLLKKEPNLVPGVIALILMLVCVMMTSISIVKEKETGTMEVLLVSPCSPSMIIFAKTIPYLLLSLVNIASILLLSVYALGVPIRGSLWLLFGESTLFIITCLALGIWISIKVRSQQVALLISLIGMLLPTILFSGFLFPIANMPRALQYLTNVVPSRWYYQAIKSIMIKGSGFFSVWKETGILLLMTGLFLAISLKNFKTRLS